MLHYIFEKDGLLQGWVLPDHPNSTPTIKVFGKNGLVAEVQANRLQTDLRDRGFHETGMIGFHIDEQVLPGLNERLDEFEFRTGDSDILVYRRFQAEKHLEFKLFKFDLQVMPDIQAEAKFSQRFALSYTSVERHPNDTMFGIINNQVATSVYLSGRPKFQRYEQLLKERGFKVIALLRDPYEELAERLLFMRFVMNQKTPDSTQSYTYGLDGLKDIVRKINFDDVQTLTSVFRNLEEAQRMALNNPMVRALSCSGDDLPRSGNVEMCLSKLSRITAVGLRSRYDDFKSVLSEALGADILNDHQPPAIKWVKQAAGVLSEVRQVRALLSLDVDLYNLVDEALSEAIGPPSHPDVEVVGRP